MSLCLVSCAKPDTVPRRLIEDPSAPLVDASERARACPRRPGVDVDDDDTCEKDGDV
jgi:hypothetical protein